MHDELGRLAWGTEWLPFHCRIHGTTDRRLVACDFVNVVALNHRWITIVSSNRVLAALSPLFLPETSSPTLRHGIQGFVFVDSVFVFLGRLFFHSAEEDFLDFLVFKNFFQDNPHDLDLQSPCSHL